MSRVLAALGMGAWCFFVLFAMIGFVIDRGWPTRLGYDLYSPAEALQPSEGGFLYDGFCEGLHLSPLNHR